MKYLASFLAVIALALPVFADSAKTGNVVKEVAEGSTIKVYDKAGAVWMVPSNDPALLTAVRNKINNPNAQVSATCANGTCGVTSPVSSTCTNGTCGVAAPVASPCANGSCGQPYRFRLFR